jgi:FkbM family methyltransferase
MSFRQKLLSILKSVFMPLRIRWALRGRSSPYIVEVGANDGKTADPIFRTIQKSSHWRAMLIEPVPHMFERLKENYAGIERCTLVNVAIAPSSGSLPIYYVDPKAKEVMPEIPDYFEQLPSFDKQKVLDFLGPKGASLLREQMVETAPLSELLPRHGIKEVDFLQIDAEGFDYEVLKTFPFDAMKPAIVCIENCHLSESDRAAASAMMDKHGYKTEKWGKDTIFAHRG